MEYLYLVVGMVLLIKCADFFVDGASLIAKVLGIPSLVIGLTIVAFGTSAPEACVSIVASLNGQNAISIGNIVGSNICNLLLVLGLSALFNPLKAKRDVVFRDYLFSLLSYIVLFVVAVDSFGVGEGYITFSEGLILLCFLGVYLYSLFFCSLKDKGDKTLSDEKVRFSFKYIFYVIVGLLGIILGGRLVVDGASNIARSLNITENLIALTMVAIGTSLPEVVTSVVAVRKGEVDIALGNVLGSNIFNIFFILGTSSVLSPLVVSVVSLIDIGIMLVVGVFLYILILKNKMISKKSGFFMLIMYLIYVVYIVYRG